MVDTLRSQGVDRVKEIQLLLRAKLVKSLRDGRLQQHVEVRLIPETEMLEYNLLFEDKVFTGKSLMMAREHR